MFRFASAAEFPWNNEDLAALRRLTLNEKRGRKGRKIGGYAFNAKAVDKEAGNPDAGDGSRRMAFIRNVKDFSKLPPWLIPLFQAVEER